MHRIPAPGIVAHRVTIAIAKPPGIAHPFAFADGIAIPGPPVLRMPSAFALAYRAALAFNDGVAVA